MAMSCLNIVRRISEMIYKAIRIAISGKISCFTTVQLVSPFRRLVVTIARIFCVNTEGRDEIKEDRTIQMQIQGINTG